MTEDEKLNICNDCEHCTYEVFQNLDWCTVSDNAVYIVVTKESCPAEKW